MGRRTFRRQFRFLLDEGFELTYFERNSEREAYFTKGRLCIGCFHDSYRGTLEIVLTAGSQSGPLLECPLFPKLERFELEDQLDVCSDTPAIFEVYAAFLKKHRARYRDYETA